MESKIKIQTLSLISLNSFLTNHEKLIQSHRTHNGSGRSRPSGNSQWNIKINEKSERERRCWIAQKSIPTRQPPNEWDAMRINFWINFFPPSLLAPFFLSNPHFSSFRQTIGKQGKELRENILSTQWTSQKFIIVAQRGGRRSLYFECLSIFALCSSSAMENSINTPKEKRG